jgi:hypothetical protein
MVFHFKIIVFVAAVKFQTINCFAEPPVFVSTLNTGLRISKLIIVGEAPHGIIVEIL